MILYIMNSFLIKDFLENTEYVYCGNKTIGEYVNKMMEKIGIGEFFMDITDSIFHVYRKIIKKGYIYDSIVIESIYKIHNIEIRKDEKEQSQKKINHFENDEFLKELKESLAKRLKNKLD
jgi:hypothetical protein